MQWDKVKNVLIGILLAVNLFLLGNLGFRLWQNYSRASGLDADLRALVSGCGSTLADSFRLPRMYSCPSSTSTAAARTRKNAASVMLGADMERTELEDGTVRFQSGDGTVTWYADGRVNGVCPIPGETPDDRPPPFARRASAFSEWGLAGDGASYQVSGFSVTQTAPVANRPVHNRELTLTFNADGTATLSGTWSFGTPYTTVTGRGADCRAADALLQFASSLEAGETIRSMTAGYRMQMDSSRRLQLIPTWKIVTDRTDYFMDCDKENARYHLKRRLCGHTASGFGGERGNSSVKTGRNLLISPKNRDMDGKAEKKLSFIQNCDTMYE